VILKIARNF